MPYTVSPCKQVNWSISKKSSIKLCTAMYGNRAGNSCTVVTQGALAEEKAATQQKEGVVAL